MGLNSGLYECSVVHDRRVPVPHRFVYPYLAFFLDLDELSTLRRKLLFFGWNRFNLFSFWDQDHIHEPGHTARQLLLEYIRSKGVNTEGCKVYLLTQLRFLGHVFNPVSFYFCIDRDGRPLCAVPEVNNTFKEMKFFFLGAQTYDGHAFSDRQVKNFYVSPFMGLEDLFEFKISIPNERIHIAIDDYKGSPQSSKKEDTPVLRTKLVGSRRELTNWALLRCCITYPFASLKVVAAIHWQALRLFLKGVPFHKKSAHPHLQTEVYRAKN